MFQSEDLIRFPDLAVSLQEIIMRKLKWEDLTPSLQKIINSRTGSGMLFQNVFADGSNGQLVKINSSEQKLFADDNFRSIKVVSTDDELNQEMSFKPISLKDVFNSWYRFCHSDHGALSQLVTGPETEYGTWQNKDFLNIWSFNEADCSISQNVDWSPVCGFINPTNFYTNYYLRIKYRTSDDDNTFIFCGFMTDASGVEHTLSICRGARDNTTCYWAFIYDAGNPTQHKIVDYTNKVGQMGDGTYTMSVKRVNNSLEFKTAAVNSDVENEDWTINWTYPDKKPDSMPQAEYDNIGVMLNQTNRVGFGVRSMNTTFYIDKQYEIFDDGDIYALHQDKVYTYNTASAQWVVKGAIHDILPNRIFLYNARLQHFFFYNYWNKYNRIVFKIKPDETTKA
jgi:hypothetical protein